MANPVRIAREERTPTGGVSNYTNDDISISLVVNARGRACLLHDRPFIGTPTWVKYLTDKRKVKLVFDNGTEYVIDYVMNDKLHKQLMNIGKLFVIRVEKGVPQEGFDTNLIKE